RSEARLGAAAGPARLHALARDVTIPTRLDAPPDIDELVRELDVSVEHFPGTPALVDRLPPDLHFIKEDYWPEGPVSVSYAWRRGTPARKEWVVKIGRAHV